MPTNVLLADTYGRGVEDRKRNALLDQQTQQVKTMAPIQAQQARANLQGTNIANEGAQYQNAIGMLSRSLRMVLASPSKLQAASQLAKTPDFQKQIQLLGGDPQKFMLEGTDATEEGVTQGIQQFLSAIEGGQQQMETIEGPDGALLQRDPSTGKLTQVMGRDQGMDRLLLQDQLARRRDLETRAARAAADAEKPTTGQEAVDREFAKEYTSFKAAGGYADVQKGLDQLRGVREQLASGSNLTGFVAGNMPDQLRALVNPQSQAVKDAVEEVVQRNLRLILGAQFTEREGIRLIERAFNPRLSEEENIIRVDRLIQQIESAAEAKMDASQYFEQNGTLRGWTGTVPSIADMETAIEGESGGMPDFSTMSDEELRRLANGG